MEMKEYVADVTVSLKKGVADPEGENTLKTLRLLGLNRVKRVEAAKRFSLYLSAEDEKEARKTAETACTKLLANPVIQTYTVEIRSHEEERARTDK